MSYYLDMPLEEAMSTQRAIRRLKPDAVDDELILHLIELALKAPVGSNAQQWEFVVVKDAAVKAGLARLNRQALSPYMKVASWRGKPADSTRKVVDSVRWQMDHFEDTPVLVVACYRSAPVPFFFLSQTSYFGSIYPAVQNLLLGARAAGLGAALITLPLWSPSRARRVLGLPHNVTPCAVIPMGWPLGKYGPTPRKPVGDVVHVDRFGHQPYRQTPAPSRKSAFPVATMLGLAAGAVVAALLLRKKDG